MSTKFDVETFKNHLRTSWIGSECLYIETIHSTNSYLKQIPSHKLVHGALLLTDKQTGGRGQYERKWESEAYKNLTFTVAFKPVRGDRLTLLTLACARAICDIFSRYTDETVKIKWPNDIYIGEKKIGGILTECIFNGQKTDRVLIGIGLNIYQSVFSSKIQEKAISLSDVSSDPIKRESLLADILVAIEQAYLKWHKFDTLLQKEIQKKLIGYGEWVHISINGAPIPDLYKFIGIGENGELLMLNEQLDVNTFRYEQIRIIPGNKDISKAV